MGYRIYSKDLSLGIFMYCLFQMCVCAVSFGYSVRFIYRYTYKHFWVALAVVLYFISNNGLIIALDADKGSAAEALSIPCQQIARLYVEEGEEVFGSEEQELLYAAMAI